MRYDDPVPELKRAAGAELARIVTGWNCEVSEMSRRAEWMAAEARQLSMT